MISRNDIFFFSFLKLADVNLEISVDKSMMQSWMTLPENCAGGAEDEKDEDSEKFSAAEKSLLLKIIRKGLVDDQHDLEVQRPVTIKDLYATLISSLENQNG